MYGIREQSERLIKASSVDDAFFVAKGDVSVQKNDGQSFCRSFLKVVFCTISVS